MSDGRNREAYQGDKKGLAIAIDFGTTYSGVSYAFLEKGVAPKIRSVTGFPGQEDQDSSTKVPSVLVYDETGVLRAVGPEAEDPNTSEMVEFEGWYKVAWFKLLLRPKDKDKELDDAPCPTMPPGKTIENLLSDFLKYMNDCAKNYIAKSHATGEKMWADVQGNITYILSHPNGWHGFQQEKMRSAAILAGLIPDTDDGRSRVHFVSEGEASFHWCVDSGLANDTLKTGRNIIVADAGGGTIDVSAFRVVNDSPLELEETKPSECRLAGSIFVTEAFEKFATASLRNSKYNDPETILRLKDEFDKKTKRLFKQDARATLVTVAGPRDNDPAFNIKSGKLMLQKEDMRDFFERSCAAAAEAILAQLIGNTHTTIFVVGGFAASPYLFSEIQERLKGHNVTIKRAESHTAKAVADGAVGYFLDRYVSARVAKYTYGVLHSTEFIPVIASHRRRMEQIYLNPLTGVVMLSGEFSAHVEKGTAVKETAVTRIALRRIIATNSDAERIELPLYAYKGNIKNVQWQDEDPDAFHNVCTFKATIPSECLSNNVAPMGIHYRTAQFEAVVSFGSAEFKCHLEWKDKQGELQKGPMSPVWNEG